MRRKSLLAGAIALAMATTGIGMSIQSANAATTITIWHNLGTTQNAEAVKALTSAYTKANPSVTFNLVDQPGDNYFALL